MKTIKIKIAILVAVFLVPLTIGIVSSANTQVKTFKLFVGNYAYKPSELVVNAGDVVKLEITGKKDGRVTKEGYVHSFSIKELGIDFKFKAGKSEFKFVAPDTSGTYKIECTAKCGDKHEQMVGKLIVK